MVKIALGVRTGCERQHELALWPGDPCSAFDEPVAQGANALERPEASARRRIVGPPRDGAHLKLAAERVRDQIAEHVDLVARLPTRREVAEPELRLGLGEGRLLRAAAVVVSKQRKRPAAS